jgi:cytochrome b
MGGTRSVGSSRTEVSWDLLVRLSGVALFVLLIIAYASEEYGHTYPLVGYGIAAVLAVNLFWLIVRPNDGSLLPIDYDPRAIKARFRHGDRAPKAIVFLFFVLAAPALCALILMLLTHMIWGTTWIDEMHEVVAHFVVGLVALYVATVALASIHHVEDHLSRIFRGSKRS